MTEKCRWCDFELEEKRLSDIMVIDLSLDDWGSHIMTGTHWIGKMCPNCEREQRGEM